MKKKYIFKSLIPYNFPKIGELTAAQRQSMGQFVHYCDLQKR